MGRILADNKGQVNNDNDHINDNAHNKHSLDDVSEEDVVDLAA